MKRNYSILLAPDTDGGNGTPSAGNDIFATPPAASSATTPPAGGAAIPPAGTTPPAKPAEGATKPAAGATTPATPVATTPAAATPPPAISAEALAQAMKDAGIGAQPAAATPAKQYTQDDFDKAFHVVRPSAAQRDAILAGGDGALHALTELLHGASRQATVMAAYQLQEFRDALEARINPVESDYKTRQEAQLYGEFFEKNPGLKPMEAAVKQVVKDLKGEKATFKDKEEAFTVVTERVTKFVKSLPGFENWTPGQALPVAGAAGATPIPGAAQAQTPKPTMPTLGGGGQGGAGSGHGGGGGEATKSAGQAVFM